MNYANAAVRHKHTAHKAIAHSTFWFNVRHKCISSDCSMLLHSPLDRMPHTETNTLHISMWCWWAYKIFHNRSQQVNFKVNCRSHIIRHVLEFSGVLVQLLHHCDMCWNSVGYWSNCSITVTCAGIQWGTGPTAPSLWHVPEFSGVLVQLLHHCDMHWNSVGYWSNCSITVTCAGIQWDTGLTAPSLWHVPEFSEVLV